MLGTNVFFFKSLSLAIICNILGQFAEHACSLADSKVSVLLKDILTIAAVGKEKTIVTFEVAWKYLKYLCVLIVFPMYLPCVTLICFLQCPMWTKGAASSCHTYYLNNFSVLMKESLLWTITPEFPIASMTLENTQPSVVIIIAQWNVDINEMMQM